MKLLQQVQSEALQPSPGLKASFALAHMQASECATFPSKIQRWLNRRDYLGRFLKQKVEIDLCFKSQQKLSDPFSRGQASWLWKLAHHRKTSLGWESEQTPNEGPPHKIMSPLPCKQKARPQKPASAKSSLTLALLSMKWDWKMVLNGLLNWRNDVLWSLPPKPPRETSIVSVHSSPEVSGHLCGTRAF